MREQHDDHCKLSMAGYNWHITRVRGTDIDVVTWTPLTMEAMGNLIVAGGMEMVTTTIDVSDMDWEAYIATATELLEYRYGGEEAERA